MKKNVTMADVAREANVSKATVSRVINNYQYIKPEIRKLVENAINALDYKPNNIARSLTINKTNIIGTNLLDYTPMWDAVAKGIERTLSTKNYSLLLTRSEWNYENEIKNIQVFIQHRVDGVLIAPMKTDSYAIRMLKDSRIPFFAINTRLADKESNWIESDSVEGSYLATKHLLDFGHIRFLYMQYDKLENTHNRFIGFKNAIKEAGLKLSDQIILGNEITRKGGYRIMNQFLNRYGKEKLPSAIVAVADPVAIGAMVALHEHNISIPDDVSIICYDDIDIAALIKVPLTTIKQPKFRMGEIAATQLVDMVEKNEKGLSRQFVMKPELIIRESCKKYIQ